MDRCRGGLWPAQAGAAHPSARHPARLVEQFGNAEAERLMEIEAAEKLIQNQRAWGLPQIEIDAVVKRLAQLRNQGIADIAPRSSEKEDHSNVKPFIGTLRVPNPARQSRASSRKQVLRGGGATLPAKRRQRDQTLCD
jgi:hypothetical protein